MTESTLRDRIEVAIRRSAWEEIDAIITDQVRNVMEEVEPELKSRDIRISYLLSQLGSVAAKLGESRDEIERLQNA